MYFMSILTTVPTFVTAHTFCASRDTPVFYGWCLLIQGCFCAVLNYAEKAELSKCSWYPKRKLGVTMRFSEIIKLQFEKKKTNKPIHCFVFYCFFRIIFLSLKNAWFPPIFFLDFNSSCLDLLTPHSQKPLKNTSLLVGTILNTI